MGGSDRDLGSAGIPLASGKGRDMMDRPVPASFPHNGDGSAICQRWAAERERQPGVEISHPLKAKERKVGEKAPSATVVSWGHAVRTYTGIRALFRWFLSGPLIS